MATLNETDEWPAGIYQIEETDPVLGGTPNEASGAGLDNIPHLQLAKRSVWLKARVEALLSMVVAASTTVVGIVQLSASVNSSSTSTAATSSAVKAANDNANTRALASRQVAGGGLATGGGDLTANRVITVPAALQAEAEAGVDNTRAMTPLRVAQAIAALVPAASFSVAGLVRLTPSLSSDSTVHAATASAVKAANDNANARALAGRSIGTGGLATGGGDLTADRTVTVPAATKAEAEAGTDHTRAMTPLRVAQAIAALVPAASAAVAGIVRLSASANSESTTTAATSSAVKQANDNANTRALASRQVTGGGLATGGGDLSANRVITVPEASVAEVSDATGGASAMTPRRTLQAISTFTVGRAQDWTRPARSIGTSYQNTLGSPIMVAVSSNGEHRAQVGLDGVEFVTVAAGRRDNTHISFIVPPGRFYRLLDSTGATFDWAELR